MSERMFLFVVGVAIVVALYFELDALIYFISGWLIFEAITDLRLTRVLQSARHVQLDSGLVVLRSQGRYRFDAERAWRLVIAISLLTVFALLHELGYEMLWFVPWFLGFAILGAGASGVCPMMLGLKWLGFR